MKQFKITFDGIKYLVKYITNKTEATIIAMELKKSEIQNFGIDIETAKAVDHPKAGLDPHLSKISLVQLYDGKDTVYIFDALEIGLDWMQHLTQKNFVAHYGIFEIKHFTHNGYPNLNIGCSMLLSILVDRAERSPFNPDAEELDEDEEEPATWKGYGLDAIIGRLFNVRVEKKLQTFDWRVRPLPADTLVYGALDAILTYRVAEVQVPKINEYKMVKHYQLLKKMQHVIVEMELAGVLINKEQHEKLIKQWMVDQEKQKLECVKHFADINLNSTKQLGTWARSKYSADVIDKWVKTKAGAIGFGKSALAEMQHLPEIEALLKYKKTAKLISTYGTTLEAQTNPVTQRIHCSFSLGETRTGRLSSRDPNLQNLPRDSTVRSLFVADRGKKLIIADFNQIELRVAGLVSGDPVILGAYERGDDLHKIFAAKMFHVPLSKVTKEQRQIAKSANFGAIYGMGPNKFMTYTLASTNGAVRLSFDEAKLTIDTLWQLYSKYAVWCKQIRTFAEIQGFVRTPLGKMRKLHQKEVYTKAPNTVVQGGAFEVMAAAMIDLKHILSQQVQLVTESTKIVNSVHDEVIVECSDQCANIVKTCVEDAMKSGMHKVFPKATLNGLAVATICDSWGEKA
jgi:DNA polymerase I